MAEERRRAAAYGGRTVFGRSAATDAQTDPDPTSQQEPIHG